MTVIFHEVFDSKTQCLLAELFRSLCLAEPLTGAQWTPLKFKRAWIHTLSGQSSNVCNLRASKLKLYKQGGVELFSIFSSIVIKPDGFVGGDNII